MQVVSTVLIADDEPGNRELLVEILQAEGFKTVTASNGTECLQQFRTHHPDLVLLDVQMPAPDGFTICRSLKRDPDTRLVPIILVTALSAVQDRVTGLEAGADDFLTKPIERSEMLARVRSLVNLKRFTDDLERAESVVFALARSIEGKDPYTQGHCERLSDYSARLGTFMGLSAEQINALRLAGIVHDIGKVAVPDSILLKPARLTAEEFAVMREHPVVGERICAPLRSFRTVLPIIRHHHEKLDGSGYPDGLKGKNIPAGARVLQVVDVYDALTTERPYKKAFSHQEAIGIMHEEVDKGWWDPAIVDVFAEMVRPERMIATGGAW